MMDFGERKRCNRLSAAPCRWRLRRVGFSNARMVPSLKKGYHFDLHVRIQTHACARAYTHVHRGSPHLRLQL